MEVWRAQQEGLEVVVVNPGVILGPIFWTEGSGEIYQKVKKSLLFYTKGTTGFVAVTDVVKIMVQLMQSTISGEKFILVSESKTYQELVSTIAEVLKVRSPKIHAGKLFTALGWRADWFLATFFGKKRMLTKNLAHSLHSVDYYSNEKIVNQLDLQFEPINSFIQKQ